MVSGTFAPDERSLGGAHRIMADYCNYYKRLEDVQPTVGAYTRLLSEAGTTVRDSVHVQHCAQRSILEANKTTWHTPATQLSTNRAAKRAAVNEEHMEHVSNVYHLNRRIENGYSKTERRKNPYDPTMFPAYQQRSTNLYRSGLHNSMMAWVPGAGRPKTAPTVRVTPPIRGDGYEGWSITRSLRGAFYGDDFPLEAWYKHNQREGTYLAYKRAMMQEIIEQRMYREDELWQLFSSYRKLAPLRDKVAVDKVVGELALELDVRQRQREKA